MHAFSTELWAVWTEPLGESISIRHSHIQFGIRDHQDASSEGQKDESLMVPRPHTAQQIAALLQQLEWKSHEHLLYSSDSAKVSFIYLALWRCILLVRLRNVEEVKEAVFHTGSTGKGQEFCAEVIHSPTTHCVECMTLQVEYGKVGHSSLLYEKCYSEQKSSQIRKYSLCIPTFWLTYVPPWSVSSLMKVPVLHTAVYHHIQDKQCMYKRNTEAHSCNHCYHAKAKTIKYSEYVSEALVIHHARHMVHIILSLSHKWYNCQKKKLLTAKVCFNFLYTFCLKHFSFKEEFSKILS
jgi:hypothetical protein